MKPIALITGATAGIGEATALLLAKNNFDLIITGRRSERLELLKENIIKQTGCKVLALNFDIRNLEETEKAINSLPEEWKAIDVLINNAGLAVGLHTVQEGVIDDWERMKLSILFIASAWEGMALSKNNVFASSYFSSTINLATSV